MFISIHKFYLSWQLIISSLSQSVIKVVIKSFAIDFKQFLRPIIEFKEIHYMYLYWL